MSSKSPRNKEKNQAMEDEERSIASSSFEDDELRIDVTRPASALNFDGDALDSPVFVREARSEGAAMSPSPLISRKGVPLSPERSRMYERGSPMRRPATPLRGIGKFLQHRRRDASPDSPSVRSDLLSGSVVAGLVATAIQEVESSAPDPQKNKPMADLIERAVKAEFKVGQLELQKKHIWQLVGIEEQQTQKERNKQANMMWFLGAMILVELATFVYVSVDGNTDAQRWIGSIIAVHASMGFTAAYIYEQLCFSRNDEDESEEEEEGEEENEPETPQPVGQRSPSLPSHVQQPNMPSARVQDLFDEINETIALLPADQKGLVWVNKGGDEVLMRFLRGHVFRVGKAFKYLIKCAEWREDYKMDSLIEMWDEKTKTRSSHLLKDQWPLFELGNLKEGKGDRLMLFRLAMCDFPGFYRSCAAEDVTKHSLCEFERNRLKCKQGGKHVVLIIDLGYNDSDDSRPINSVAQLRAWIAGAMQYLGTMTKLCDPYFPDTFSRIIFTRAPAPFWATWRVAQLLIPERTREKIVVLSGESAPIKLSELLPGEEQLIPDFLGGKLNGDFRTKGGLVVRNKTTSDLARDE